VVLFSPTLLVVYTSTCKKKNVLANSNVSPAQLVINPAANVVYILIGEVSEMASKSSQEIDVSNIENKSSDAQIVGSVG